MMDNIVITDSLAEHLINKLNTYFFVGSIDIYFRTYLKRKLRNNLTNNMQSHIDNINNDLKSKING